MANPILRISDGSTKINLLALHGWSLDEWSPAVPEPKGGGVFRDSPLNDGKRLAYRKIDNVYDTFHLVGSGDNQNILIRSIQELERLLEKATSYWTGEWQNEPVWLEASGSCEDEIRYAVIVDYRLTGFGSPFRQPFFNSRGNVATKAILAIEHLVWQETPPNEDGNCVELHNETDYPSVVTVSTDTFEVAESAGDATYGSGMGYVDLDSDYLGIGFVAGDVAEFVGNSQSGMIFDNVTIPVDATIVSATLEIEGLAVIGTAPYTAVEIRGQSQKGGVINSVTVVTGGQWYAEASASVIDIGSDGEGGQGAVLGVTTVNGVVTEIYIIEGGFDYNNPIIVIKDIGIGIGGYGATATCTATAKNVDATVFDGTIPDFTSRTRTNSSVIVACKEGESMIEDIDVTDIVREIVSHEAWSSGDKLGLFMKLFNEFGGRAVYSWDDDTRAAPQITVTWSTDTVSLGRDTTCAQEVFVGNKHNNAPINYAFCYDDSAGVKWSPNLIEWDYSSNMPLFQSNAAAVITPAVGDILYFGSAPINATDTNFGPFSSLVFDLYSTQVTITGKWQYYNTVGADGGWEDYDVTGETSELCGNQVNFNVLGVGFITFIAMPDWDTVTVNGITGGYWIRYKVTAVGVGVTSPYQQHRDIYTVLLPYMDIDASEVPGDIPALARILFDSTVCPSRGTNVVALGLRSLSRGENFSAYLNASDVQDTIGLIFDYDTDYCALSTDTLAPTGKSLTLTDFSETSLTPICTWSFGSDIAPQYAGVYHAYVRCSKLVDNSISIGFRLQARFGVGINNSYSDTNSFNLYNASTEITIVDLGQISIMQSGSFSTRDVLQNLNIILSAYVSAEDDFSVYDVILIPSDEWSGCFSGTESVKEAHLYEGLGLEIDAITNPRRYRAIVKDVTSFWTPPGLPTPSPTTPTQILYMGDYARTASSEPIFQANADQRLWFLQYTKQDAAGRVYSRFEAGGAIRAERSARYLLMRGDR